MSPCCLCVCLSPNLFSCFMRSVSHQREIELYFVFFRMPYTVCFMKMFNIIYISGVIDYFYKVLNHLQSDRVLFLINFTTALYKSFSCLISIQEHIAMDADGPLIPYMNPGGSKFCCDMRLSVVVLQIIWLSRNIPIRLLSSPFYLTANNFRNAVDTAYLNNTGICHEIHTVMRPTVCFINF